MRFMIVPQHELAHRGVESPHVLVQQVVPVTAAKIVERLRQSGLNELNLSIDDFHLPFVKPTHVKLAFEAARRVDFDAVILVHCSGPNTVFNDVQLGQGAMRSSGETVVSRTMRRSVGLARNRRRRWIGNGMD